MYHDNRIMEFPYFKAMTAFHAAGLIDLRFFGVSDSICGSTGMLARLNPVFDDQDVDYVACRDIDSIPTPRERRCVEEFIASGKAVSTIHDNPAHAGLMGGTLCVKAKRFKEIAGTRSVSEMITRHGSDIDYTKHGADQHLLNRMAVTVIPSAETLIHELDHQVGDMNAEIRLSITTSAPTDIPTEVAEMGDSFTPMIGGCTAPLPAFDFYDNEAFPNVTKIRECEKKAGVDAREMMERIAKL